MVLGFSLASKNFFLEIVWKNEKLERGERQLDGEYLQWGCLEMGVNCGWRFEGDQVGTGRLVYVYRKDSNEWTE